MIHIFVGFVIVFLSLYSVHISKVPGHYINCKTPYVTARTKVIKTCTAKIENSIFLINKLALFRFLKNIGENNY